MTKLRPPAILAGMNLLNAGVGRRSVLWLAVGLIVSWGSGPCQAQPRTLGVRISFGHRAPQQTTITPRVLAGSPGVEVTAASRSLTVGGGRVEAVTAAVSWSEPTRPARQPHSTWAYLLQHGSPDQSARLKDDPGLRPDAPLLTVQTVADGTRGFTIGLEQLLRHKALWLPAHDAFVTLADAPVAFEAHVAALKGERVLDRVRREPEATWTDWTNRWEDIGNPYQWSPPWQSSWLGTRGHLVGMVARHGSLYKFGVDRWGAVRPDHGSPHRFRLDPIWPGCRWLGQRIVDGLPILITTLERRGQRCELEQLAAPLHDHPPAQPREGGDAQGTVRPTLQRPARRGEICSVFLTKVQLSGTGPVSLGFRLATENTNRHPELRHESGWYWVTDRETGAVWLMIEPGPGLRLQPRLAEAYPANPNLEFDCVGDLAPGETNTIVLKLPSPVLDWEHRTELQGLNWAETRAAVVRYWESWLAQGAQFRVPEQPVNDLFRASLWHALMLPRFREPDRIDLPYSNFAYGQLNADWPINQAVYVDYMLYGLRGYFELAAEELAAMYRSQQKPDGRVSGYADWGVYSPAMLYAVGQNYLLSRNRTWFDRLLPASLKTLDWCLEQVARAQTSAVPGLIVAPLNDLTQEARAWAFVNAYFVAGLEVFGRALAAYGHPRAEAVRAVATQMRVDVEQAFARASVRAPVVQLADGTWVNYVPSDALEPRRLLEQWYPTDVDTGPLHLARLGVLEPRGWLTDALVHDHEDNLFLKQWGMANEPVYNPQATVYLRRDEPEAAIRAFYSMLACAFSHHQLVPLEHRWAWGQYYGPPSTDGAWFELYRNMLVNELHGPDTLFIGQAVPRAWLADGQQIVVSNAPTYFGRLNLRIDSAVAQGRITARIELPEPHRPATLLVRLRHPHKQPLRAVTVNGVPWNEFDPAKELIRIPGRLESLTTVVAQY